LGGLDVSNRTIARPIAWPRLRLLAVAAAIAGAALAGCASPGASSPGASSPGAPPATGATPPVPLAGHPLLGTWTTDITRADLAAGGVPDSGVQNENSGRFLWTFAADGTWTQVQQSLDGAPVNNPVFRGTFTIDGDQLTATTEFPQAYRDSGLHYTWTIDGDEVRFDLLDPPDPVLPLIVESHPWTRAG
jgi:hypothetical protein